MKLSLDSQKMLFGFCLLIINALLIVVIGIGKVEDATSAGLKELIGGLLVMDGGFAAWCFNDRGRDKDADRREQ